MKHLFTSCVVLVFAILLPPTSAAAPRCLHFTNFCDTILFDTAGPLILGNWDWECLDDYKASSILGQTGARAELTSRPYDPYEATLESYVYEFSFEAGNVFSFYGTEGVENTLVVFQTDQPYTVTNGQCMKSDVDTSKPRMISVPVAKVTTQEGSQEVDRCIHFANFCDTIVLATSSGFAYGNWDWNCTQDWTDTPIIGNAEAGRELGTRPGFAYGYTFAYSTEFSPKAGNLFDLYLTNGVGGRVFTGRKNQPYTVTNGACSPSDVDKSKPRMLIR